MIKQIAVTAILASLAQMGSASAHPGPALLITGSEQPRSAMTPGVSYETKAGTHIFRGTSQETDNAIEIAGSLDQPRIHKRIELHIDTSRYRPVRALCTQGFFSGKCSPRSRRFTQGFFSGQKILGTN